MLFNSYSEEILHKQFYWIYLQGDYCWLLLITGLNLKSKSFTTYRVTLYNNKWPVEMYVSTIKRLQHWHICPHMILAFPTYELRRISVATLITIPAVSTEISHYTKQVLMDGQYTDGQQTDGQRRPKNPMPSPLIGDEGIAITNLYLYLFLNKSALI